MKVNCFVLYLIGFILMSNNAQAQWYNSTKINKKAVTLFNDAYEAVKQNNFDKAIATLNNALTAEPNYLEALQARASIYFLQKNYKQALIDYDLLFSKDTLYAKEYLPEYAHTYAGVGNFEKAVLQINKVLSSNSLSAQKRNYYLKQLSNFEFGVNYLKGEKFSNYIFKPENLGNNINTQSLEYLPSITVDGKKLIFNRRVNGDEDFYESEKINNAWQPTTPLAGKINTNLNEGAQNISQDGTWLIFTGCDYPEGLGSCDLYLSVKNNDGTWGEALNMGRNINTRDWETAPSLSADKSTLYFASTRAGGFGGSDIWISKNINGVWQKPENAGPQINTSENENFPFIHADNESLYFSSNGLAGYGKMDLYVVKKDTAEQWQKPTNLGYPINTIDDETSLIVAADGRTAFYASDKTIGNNNIDLFTFQLRENVTAKKTLWVKGKVYDKKTNTALPAEVELISIENNKTISILKTDAEGNYLITLPTGKNYAFEVAKKGYLFYSENFSLKDNLLDSALVLNISLQAIEKGASIILKNIFFDTKKANLEKASFTELDRVVKLLKENNNLTIQISGHTDNVGQAKDNLLLSNNRAKAVTTYLIQKGIVAKRLVSKGFGSTKPIAVNTTDIGRANNRRTELSILSN
jgi:outer membrane protein OmpA-like peptidoglycan-associated protein